MKQIKSSPFLWAISEMEVIFIVILVAVLFVFISPFFMPKRYPTRQTTCTSNQKQIALSFIMYTYENDGIFPQATENWAATIDVKGKILECPNDKNSGSSYAYNANLASAFYKRTGETGDFSNIISITDNSNTTLTVNNSEIILTADSDAKSGIMRGKKDVAFWHKDGAILSFADGHVLYVKKDKMADVRFEIGSKQEGEKQ